MATTESTRRVAGVVSLAVLATLAVWAVSRSGTADPEPSRPVFWEHLAGQPSEPDPPRDVDEITHRADAVVLAHVTDVTEGREMRGAFDPTPPLSTAVPLPRSAFVVLSVDKVLDGTVTTGQTLRVEMQSPPKPLTLDTMRSRIPDGQLLFFLWSSVERHRAAGFTSALVQQREQGIWTLASSRGLIGARADGLYEVLHEDDADVTFLRSFQATTLDAAAARAAQAAG
ncbi:MAG TPA: hypothetical protein VMZ11_08540 [Mycobacteriales bacterium]|nr:hypothetical protein [Mycobacteriales bacterium]